MIRPYDAIYRGLLEAFGAGHHRLGKAIAAFEQDAGRIQFADGLVESCDLLVCVDGNTEDYL